MMTNFVPILKLRKLKFPNYRLLIHDLTPGWSDLEIRFFTLKSFTLYIVSYSLRATLFIFDPSIH